MYQYTDFDRQFIRHRAAQHRDQLERNLAGPSKPCPALRNSGVTLRASATA